MTPISPETKADNVARDGSIPQTPETVQDAVVHANLYCNDIRCRSNLDAEIILNAARHYVLQSRPSVDVGKMVEAINDLSEEIKKRCYKNGVTSPSVEKHAGTIQQARNMKGADNA